MNSVIHRLRGQPSNRKLTWNSSRRHWKFFEEFQAGRLWTDAGVAILSQEAQNMRQ